MARPPKVLNVQTDRKTVITVVVDRTTPWGNPFRMQGEHTRERVCRQYEEWLRWWIMDGQEITYGGILDYKRSNKWIVEHIGELKGKDLMCHCAPKQCHADILLKLANERTL